MYPANGGPARDPNASIEPIQESCVSEGTEDSGDSHGRVSFDSTGDVHAIAHPVQVTERFAKIAARYWRLLRSNVNVMVHMLITIEELMIDSLKSTGLG